MTTRRVAAAAIGAVVVVGLLVTTGGVWAQTPARWTASTGDVRVTCRLTVGGSFEAKTTALVASLAVDPAARVLAGEVSVDVTTLDTGIALRNQHMRENYLEVQKPGFETAVLSEIDAGVLTPTVSDGTRDFTAQLHLHGTTRPVSGRVTFRQRNGVLRVDASFPVRIADHGIPDPRYLGVGVRDEVTVRVIVDVQSPS